MLAPGQVWAVIVAAGSGTRFGGHKQFASLAGREVLDWSLEAASRACAGSVLVVPAPAMRAYSGKATEVVAGGPTRPGSVRAGLAAVPPDAEIVVVHDAARPLASRALWEAVIAAVLTGADAAVPCLAVSDTIKQRQDDGSLLTLERARLVAAQTPQAFLATSLRSAHQGRPEATDDAALVERRGGKVVEVPGEPSNLKLTCAADLAIAEALLPGLLGGPVPAAAPRAPEGLTASGPQ